MSDSESVRVTVPLVPKAHSGSQPGRMLSGLQWPRRAAGRGGHGVELRARAARARGPGSKSAPRPSLPESEPLNFKPHWAWALGSGPLAGASRWFFRSNTRPGLKLSLS